MTPLDDASTDAAQQDHRGLGLVTAFLPAPLVGELGRRHEPTAHAGEGARPRCPRCAGRRTWPAQPRSDQHKGLPVRATPSRRCRSARGSSPASGETCRSARRPPAPEGHRDAQVLTRQPVRPRDATPHQSHLLCPSVDTRQEVPRTQPVEPMNGGGAQPRPQQPCGQSTMEAAGAAPASRHAHRSRSA